MEIQFHSGFVKPQLLFSNLFYTRLLLQANATKIPYDSIFIVVSYLFLLHLTVHIIEKFVILEYFIFLFYVFIYK